MADIQSTPSKHAQRQVGSYECLSPHKRQCRYSLSTLRRVPSDPYQTPSACRIINHQPTPRSCGSVSKLCIDETPIFLRRNHQRTRNDDEYVSLGEGVPWSPVTARQLPKQFAGRGLSSLVRGLRDMEEGRLDEDLDILKEVEKDSGTGKRTPQSDIQLEDNQIPDIPLGPNGGLETGDDEWLGNQLKGRDGVKSKIWKKKGQKRTTRKTVMKPNVTTWKPEPVWNRGCERGDENVELNLQDAQVVLNRSCTADQTQNHEDSQSEVNPGEWEKMKRAGNAGKGKVKERFAVTVTNRISATARANFRALRIKNRQLKGRQGRSYRTKR
ncbi:regulatory particle non-ATPase [Lecanora helva]